MNPVERVAERFRSEFAPENPSWRTIGREAEHPLVFEDGTAADLAALWPHLLEGGGFEVEVDPDAGTVFAQGERFAYSAEVGRGTIEVIGNPEQDLHGVAEAHAAAMARLLRAADREGVRVLGFGVQPVSPATPELMTPKTRYGILHEAIGDLWLSFTRTASDQVQIDVGRPELIAITNTCNLLAPVTVGLLGNSSIADGAWAGVCSLREAQMGMIGIDSARHGMPHGPFRDVRHAVELAFGMDFWMDRVDGEVVQRTGTFADFAVHADPARLFEAYLVHEHYIWHAARPRSAHSTLELRSAGQQPNDSSMVATAWGLAQVEAAAEMQALLDDRYDDPWDELHAWHGHAVATGLKHLDRAFLRELVLVGMRGLERRGRGEQVFLEPLLDRLERGKNPAQDARDWLASDGIVGFVERARMR